MLRVAAVVDCEKPTDQTEVVGVTVTTDRLDAAGAAAVWLMIGGSVAAVESPRGAFLIGAVLSLLVLLSAVARAAPRWSA